MSAFDADVPQQFPALDSDAFADGRPFDAHKMRVMVDGANRLLGKRMQLFNFVWPIVQTTQAAGQPIQLTFPYSAVAGLNWQQVIPPIRIPKMPGHNRMDVRYLASLAGTSTFQFQTTTLALPFRPGASIFDPQVLRIEPDGDDDIDTYVHNDLTISEGQFEEISLWVRAEGVGGPANAALRGSPTSGNTFGGFSFSTIVVAVPPAITWITGPGAYDESGHSIRFTVSIFGSPIRVTATRKIVRLRVDPVTGTGFIDFAPPLAFDQVFSAQWEIFEQPSYAISCFMGFSQRRDLSRAL